MKITILVVQVIPFSRLDTSQFLLVGIYEGAGYYEGSYIEDELFRNIIQCVAVTQNSHKSTKKSTTAVLEPGCTRWFKYDRDDLCVNKSQFVPVIFEPPCI
jgi:hypothetical protein